MPPAGNTYVNINPPGAHCFIIFYTLNCTGLANPDYYYGNTPVSNVEYSGASVPTAVTEITLPRDYRAPAEEHEGGFRSMTVCCYINADPTPGDPRLDASLRDDTPIALELTPAWLQPVPIFGSVVLQTLNQNTYDFLLHTSFLSPGPFATLSVYDLTLSQR